MKMNARPAQWNDDRVAEHSEIAEGRQSSNLAMPFLELGSDFLLLMIGCIAGGALGHLLQRTTSFSVSPRQLLFGSLIYSTLFVTLLREQGRILAFVAFFTSKRQKSRCAPPSRPFSFA